MLGTIDLISKLGRFALALVFIYAGGTKLLNPTSFAVLMEAYGILPEFLLLPAALVLPALEVAAGVGLIFGVRGSLGTVAGLLALFILVVGYGIHMGLDVDCGCFGPGDPEAEAFHSLRPTLYRDLAMLAGVFLLAGWKRYRSRSSLITIRDNV